MPQAQPASLDPSLPVKKGPGRPPNPKSVEEVLEQQIKDGADFNKEMRSFASELIASVRGEMSRASTEGKLSVLTTLSEIMEKISKSNESMAKAWGMVENLAHPKKEAGQEVNEQNVLEFLSKDGSV